MRVSLKLPFFSESKTLLPLSMRARQVSERAGCYRCSCCRIRRPTPGASNGAAGWSAGNCAGCPSACTIYHRRQRMCRKEMLPRKIVARCGADGEIHVMPSTRAPSLYLSNPSSNQLWSRPPVQSFSASLQVGRKSRSKVNTLLEKLIVGCWFAQMT